MVQTKISPPVPHWELGIGPITCHAWNKDRTQLAASTNNEIHIFERIDKGWHSIHVLKEHDLLITGLDWAPNTNRLVSCSHDKNAFVWTMDEANKQWKPELVLVRINRAATCVKWSPQENKFAVGTGARLVAVCYYERENDWWVSKQIKKPIHSTVLSLDWHPNNVLIAVGSCDFKTRVFSAYVKEIDEKPAPNPWGTKMPFGELLKEYRADCWVHDVTFSPSGCRLAWVAHDSTISVVDKSSPQQQDQPITHKTTCLPFVAVRWINENSILVAGYDCSPMLYTFDGTNLKLHCKLDVPPEAKGDSNVNSAFAMFRAFDKKAAEVTGDSTQLKTLHQNTIVQMKPHTVLQGNLCKFSTCGLDGIVALWDVQSRLNIKVAQNGTAAATA